MKPYLLIAMAAGLAACASITNDAFVPVALSFSDGTTGSCQISNKRISMIAEIPSTPMIRRSDDDLKLNCTTEDGRTAFAAVPSTMGEMIYGNIVIGGLIGGIVDAETDKHRQYPASFVIPIKSE